MINRSIQLLLYYEQSFPLASSIDMKGLKDSFGYHHPNRCTYSRRKGHWPGPCPLWLYYCLGLETSWKIWIFGKTAALLKNRSGYTLRFTLKAKLKFFKDSCCCLVTKFCLTLLTPCPWNFSGKNIGVSCHFLLQGIFLTQGSNLGLLGLPYLQVGSLPLSHQGSSWSTVASIWKIKSSLGAKQFFTVKLITKLRLIKSTVLKSFCMHNSDLVD